ncbi:MAG: hypothetical protein ACREBV_02815 [Candidatus Zixiibacteriota bacterium]
MTKMKSHPARQELLAAIRSGENTYKEHFSVCNWCGLYFELLSKFELAGEIPFPSAPNVWVKKAVAIAAEAEKTDLLKSTIARIVFDSWAAPAAVGIRGEALVQERRLRMEAPKISFDLRAERRKNHWDFTARITDEQGKVIKGTLMAGKKELKADEDGFYQWSSARPPQDFRLLTSEGEIEIPELTWKKT